jgi:exopolysaccharide biosynthesis WecB/TagA/CpsF family protein
MQRIYATTFFDKKALAEHLNRLEEAKKRDHRKIGTELSLFVIRPEAPGQVFWLRLRVYFLGGAPGVAQAASATLLTQLPTLQICGHDAPPLGFEREPEVLQKVIDTAKAAKPHIIFVALGCPKQELFMRMVRRDLAPAVLLGIGASLDFIAGVQSRAPTWMSRVGLEWTYRMMKDPKRLAHRYLVRDRAIAGIFLRQLMGR